MRRYTYPHKLFRFILLKSQDFHSVQLSRCILQHLNSLSSLFFRFFQNHQKPNQKTQPRHKIIPPPCRPEAFQSTPKSRLFYNTFSFCQNFFSSPEDQTTSTRNKNRNPVKPNFASPSPLQPNQVSNEEPRILHHLNPLSSSDFNFSKFPFADLIDMITGNRNNCPLVFDLFSIDFDCALLNHPNSLRCACHQARVFQ